MAAHDANRNQYHQQITDLLAWIDKEFPVNHDDDTSVIPPMLLMPAKGPTKAHYKRPLYPHKDGAYTREQMESILHSSEAHLFENGVLLLLNQNLIVIDVDDMDWANSFENEIPDFKKTVTALTDKGKHFFFRATPEAIQAGVKDCARAFGTCADGSPKPIDIKTACSGGTRGILSVPPSCPVPDSESPGPFTGKRWLRPPFPVHCLQPVPLLPLPEAFLDIWKAYHSAEHPADRNHNGTKKDMYDKDIPSLSNIQAILDCLNPSRSVSYQDWIYTGIALHNTPQDNPDQLLPLWDKFSRLCPDKYIQGECDRKWITFGGRLQRQPGKDGLGYGSLCMWAEKDNRDKYMAHLATPIQKKVTDASGNSYNTCTWFSPDPDNDPIFKQLKNAEFSASSITQHIQLTSSKIHNSSASCRSISFKIFWTSENCTTGPKAYVEARLSIQPHSLFPKVHAQAADATTLTLTVRWNGKTYVNIKSKDIAYIEMAAAQYNLDRVKLLPEPPAVPEIASVPLSFSPGVGSNEYNLQVCMTNLLKCASLSPDNLEMFNKTMQYQSPSGTMSIIDTTKPGTTINTDYLALLKKCLPSHFGSLEDIDCTVTEVSDKQIVFKWGNVFGALKANSGVVDLDSGNLLGMLVPNHPVKGPLSNINEHIPPETDCTYNQVSLRKYVLKSITPNIDLEIHVDNNEDDDKPVSARLRRAGQKDVIIKQTKLADLHEKVTKASRSHIQDTLGKDFFNMFQNATFVQQNINIVNKSGGIVSINTASGSDNIKEEHIVRYMLNQPKYKEAFFDRVFAVSDPTKSNTNNIYYYCNPSTNTWTIQCTTFMENLLLDLLEKDPNITPAQLEHIWGRNTRTALVYCATAKKFDMHFPEKLDNNLDVFTLNNCIVDTSNGTPEIRPIRPSDFVNATAGWSYCKEQALLHRQAVNQFLEQVFPQQPLRTAFLQYAASLLSGHRRIKQFLVMTDRRDGNNGKSAVCKLLAAFFGKLCNNMGKKLLAQASFEKGRDGHDAGAQVLAGKRIVIGEELGKNMTLDTDFIKNVTGGSLVTMEGRKFKSESSFLFTIQCGIIITFNENRMPKACTSDRAFVERMLIIPMISKFVEPHILHDMEEDEENVKEYTFPKQVNIETKFNDWRSALLDVLCEYYDPNLTEISPPALGLDWRNKLVCSANPYQAHFENHIKVTGVKTDYFHVRDLKALCGVPLNNNDFVPHLKTYIASIPGKAKFVADGQMPDGQRVRPGVRFAILVQGDHADYNF